VPGGDVGEDGKLASRYVMEQHPTHPLEYLDPSALDPSEFPGQDLDPRRGGASRARTARQWRRGCTGFPPVQADTRRRWLDGRSELGVPRRTAGVGDPCPRRGPRHRVPAFSRMTMADKPHRPEPAWRMVRPIHDSSARRWNPFPWRAAEQPGQRVKCCRATPERDAETRRERGHDRTDNPPIILRYPRVAPVIYPRCARITTA
jgi:hypothetical protein